MLAGCDTVLFEQICSFAVTTEPRLVSRGVQPGQAYTDPLPLLSSEAGSGSDKLPPGEDTVVVKAGTRELVAPRVTVALGTATPLTIAIRKNQPVLE